MRYVLITAGIAFVILVVWGINGMHHALMERKRLELSAIPYRCKVVQLVPSKMIPTRKYKNMQGYAFATGWRVYKCDEGTRTARN